MKTKLTFSNLFFVTKEQFPGEKQADHERHHGAVSWVYFCTLTLGFWLIAGPPTFGYEVEALIWSNLISGVVLIAVSYLAMKPYLLWAQWGVIFIGIWLMVAPVIFWAEEGAALLNNYLIGTLIVVFGIVIPRQPGIKLFTQPGPGIPPGWSYNPSTWDQRIPVIFLAWIGFFVARYMGAFQLGYLESVWDPIFGEGTYKVLTSKISKSFPVSDSMLGAFSYLLDILFGCVGGIHRWRTMPWVVVVFGILVIPLGVVSITLIILQPLSVGFWCFLCLTSALISMIMIPFTIDEVLATVQLMKHEKKVRGRSYWNTLWFGGTMEGGKDGERTSTSQLIPHTWREMTSDLLERPWNLFLSLLLGIWIMAGYDMLGYEGAVKHSSNITGALTITFSIIAMSDVGRSVRFILIPFGLWLIAAPWILGTEYDFAIWNGIITGVALILLALPKGKLTDDHGGFDKYIR